MVCTLTCSIWKRSCRAWGLVASVHWPPFAWKKLTFPSPSCTSEGPLLRSLENNLATEFCIPKNFTLGWQTAVGRRLIQKTILLALMYDDIFLVWRLSQPAIIPAALKCKCFHSSCTWWLTAQALSQAHLGLNAPPPLPLLSKPQFSHLLNQDIQGF